MTGGNGQPPQSTTGVDRTSASHSQPSNCSGMTIATTASGTETIWNGPSVGTRYRRCLPERRTSIPRGGATSVRSVSSHRTSKSS